MEEEEVGSFFGQSQEIKPIHGFVELSDSSRSSQKSAVMRQQINRFQNKIENIESRMGDFGNKIEKIDSSMNQMKGDIEKKIENIDSSMNQMKGNFGQLKELILGMIKQQPVGLQQLTYSPLQIKEERHQEGRRPIIQQESQDRQHRDQLQDEDDDEEDRRQLYAERTEHYRSRSRERQNGSLGRLGSARRTHTTKERKDRFVKMIRVELKSVKQVAKEANVYVKKIYRWLKKQ